MTDEKIFELAAQFDDDSPEFVMSTEAVIDFAQAVIKEERKRIKRIVEEVAWQGDHDKWFDCVDALVERIEQ